MFDNADFMNKRIQLFETIALKESYLCVVAVCTLDCKIAPLSSVEHSARALFFFGLIAEPAVPI